MESAVRDGACRQLWRMVNHEGYVALLQKCHLPSAEKKPKKGTSKAKTPPTPTAEEEPKEEIHASLTVSIQLLEGAITKISPKSLEKEIAGKPPPSAHPVRLQT